MDWKFCFHYYGNSIKGCITKCRQTICEACSERLRERKEDKTTYKQSQIDPVRLSATISHARPRGTIRRNKVTESALGWNDNTGQKLHCNVKTIQRRQNDWLTN